MEVRVVRLVWASELVEVRVARLVWASELTMVVAALTAGEFRHAFLLFVLSGYILSCCFVPGSL